MGIEYNFFILKPMADREVTRKTEASRKAMRVYANEIKDYDRQEYRDIIRFLEDCEDADGELEQY